ncbi:hypothetical protein HDU76_014005 [Blyttiomyces sp. JEL0837]|nr:hypothetical protein HDU76_014005 [Blyttiomyces sp. JEL0837]
MMVEMDGTKGEAAGEKAFLKTSQCYRTEKLPRRFEEPDSWKYKIKKQHPLYSTTSNMYGRYPPTVHEMPTKFHGQSSKFTEAYFIKREIHEK